MGWALRWRLIKGLLPLNRSYHWQAAMHDSKPVLATYHSAACCPIVSRTPAAVSDLYNLQHCGIKGCDSISLGGSDIGYTIAMAVSYTGSSLLNSCCPQFGVGGKRAMAANNRAQRTLLDVTGAKAAAQAAAAGELQHDAAHTSSHYAEQRPEFVCVGPAVLVSSVVTVSSRASLLTPPGC